MKDKPTMIFYIYGLIIILLFSLCSCGSRKSAVNKSQEQTQTTVSDNSSTTTTQDTNVKTTTTVNVDDKNETVTEETTYEPKDPEKESFVIEKDGTKTVLNNAKKTVKKTTQKNNTKSEVKQHVNSDTKSNIKEQKDVKQVSVSKKGNSSKEVDKKQFNPFVLIITVIGVLVLLCVIYLLYKKFMLP